MASRTGEGGEGLAGDQGGGAPQTFCDAVVEMRHDHSFDYRTRFPAGFIGRAFLFTRILDPPGDVVIGHLQLGQQDGAVLSASGGDGYNQDKNKKGQKCT